MQIWRYYSGHFDEYHLASIPWSDGAAVYLPKIDFVNANSPSTYSAFVKMSKAMCDNYITFNFNGTSVYALTQAGVKLV